MSEGTGIEWTDATWNPVVGCTRASKGCDHCYAVTMTHRLESMGQAKYAGLTVLNNLGERHFNGVVRCVDEALTVPLHWRKPRMVFVNSMSDLFHRDVPFEFIDRVFAVMALCPRHVFQVLTKRPERMAEYLTTCDWTSRRRAVATAMDRFEEDQTSANNVHSGDGWPLPNVWLGTSCEDQAAADERIPHLLRCPAAVRFLSLEPLLGPIDLNKRETICKTWSAGGLTIGTYLDWVIVGGESGKGARPCHVECVRSIVKQCADAGVPCFVKQLGGNIRDRNDAGFDAETWTWAEGPREGRPVQESAWPSPVDVRDNPDGYDSGYQGAPVRVVLKDHKGGDWDEWPEDLRVRQWPDAPRAPGVAYAVTPHA